MLRRPGPAAAPDDSGVRERHSALFASCLTSLGHRILDGFDVESLACTAAACVAGRAAVAALGDAPWRKAVAAIRRDLTHNELPPLRALGRTIYTTGAARKAGEAAYARFRGVSGAHPAGVKKYFKAHRAVMDAAAKVRLQELAHAACGR